MMSSRRSAGAMPLQNQSMTWNRFLFFQHSLSALFLP